MASGEFFDPSRVFPTRAENMPECSKAEITA